MADVSVSSISQDEQALKQLQESVVQSKFVPGSPTGFNPNATGPKTNLFENFLTELIQGQITNQGIPALGQGFGTLGDIIGLQGKTDPKLFNEQLSDISRTGQGQQDALQGQLARLGLGSSGAGQAVGGALRGATGNRRAGAIANEQALTEERKRRDLNLLLQFVMDPTAVMRGQDMGVPTSPSAQSTTGATVGAGVGAGVGSIWGPAGTAIGGAIGEFAGGLFDDDD